MVTPPPPTLKPAPVSDLALDEDHSSTRFVTLVVVMMTALATLAIGGAEVVHALRGTWVSAMTGNFTVEIPAVARDGTLRGPDAVANFARQIEAELQADSTIAQAHALPRREVESLVQPWMGRDAMNAELPLPALVAVKLKDSGDTGAAKRIEESSRRIDAEAMVETHQAWLRDLQRFSLALLLAALLMTAATVASSIVTVTGAVRARLAAHHADIDLLHLMGATDDYIAQQFVRVVVRSVGQATIIGAIIGLLCLKVAGMIAGELQSAMLPAFSWNLTSLFWLAACPALVVGLSYLAARWTVLRSLRVMP